MITVYNCNHYISHMLYDQTLMNHVYTQKTLITSQLSIEWFIKYVKQQYKCEIKIIWLNKETALCTEFKKITADERLIIKRSLSYTQILNEVAEKSERVIINKFYYLWIIANLFKNLWSESSKLTDYLLNRISIYRLK